MMLNFKTLCILENFEFKNFREENLIYFLWLQRFRVDSQRNLEIYFGCYGNLLEF